MSQSMPQQRASSQKYKLHPKSVWIFFFRFIWVFIIYYLLFLLLFATLLPFSAEFYLIFSPVLLALVVGFCIAWAKLSYHFYRFELSNEGFRKELGVVFKRYTSIPYERIQNVSITRGIIDRILGLSRVQVFTAGTALNEGNLPGLSKESAEQIRDHLVHSSRQARMRGL